MITGDRLETAVAIAKDAGLLTDTTQRALTSAELNKMSDEEVKAIIPQRMAFEASPSILAFSRSKSNGCFSPFSSK